MISNNVECRRLQRRLRRFVRPGVSLYVKRQGSKWMAVVGGRRSGLMSWGDSTDDLFLLVLHGLVKCPHLTKPFAFMAKPDYMKMWVNNYLSSNEAQTLMKRVNDDLILYGRATYTDKELTDIINKQTFEAKQYYGR